MKAKSLKNNKTKKHVKKGVQCKESITVEASIKQIAYIDFLLTISALSIEEKEDIENSLSEISEGQALETINYLIENAVDLVDSGFNYGQKDILKKLSKFIW